MTKKELEARVEALEHEVAIVQKIITVINGTVCRWACRVMGLEARKG